MKKVFLLMMIGSLLIAGCATRVSDNQRSVAPAEELPREAQVGMSREEIERIYGRPKAVIMTQTGETWHYDNTAMLWIPFNFGYHFRQSNFVFDRTGHLQRFTIDR